MEKEPIIKNTKIYILMIIATIFWAGAFVAGKIGISEMSPVQLTFYRFLFASILIFIIMIKKEKSWRIESCDIHKIIIMGIVGMVGYHIFFFMALRFTTVGNASIIAAANPMITMILSIIFLNEKLSFRRVAIFVMALTGVLLTLTGWELKTLFSMDLKKGELIMLLGTTCLAVYTIMVKRMVKKYSPLVLTTYCFIVCAFAMFPFALREGLLPDVSLKAWLLCFYMAVFASVFAYLVQQMAIKQIGASRTSLFINLVPFFSVALSFVVLGEKTSLLNILSGVIIVTAVYLNSKTPIEIKGTKKNDSKELI